MITADDDRGLFRTRQAARLWHHATVLNGGTWQNSQLEVFAWRSPHLTD
jgi:hypothetical protein